MRRWSAQPAASRLITPHRRSIRTPMTDRAAQPILRKDYRPPSHWIDSVELDVRLGEDATEVGARLEMRRNEAVNNGREPLALHGEELELLDVSLDGRALAAGEFVVEAERLVLPRVPERFTLATRVRIHPERNTQLSGLYRSSGNFCTQCEAEGFRRITYFPDRPDVMAVYTTRIEADIAEAPVLLANGNLRESGELPGGRHFAVWHDPWPPRL
jgi:aminopeptidase N